MDDHDHHYEIHCGDCHSISRASLPLLVCPRCLSHDVGAVAQLSVVDTSEAFRPGSPHWGCHVSPTAKVVGPSEGG